MASKKKPAAKKKTPAKKPVTKKKAVAKKPVAKKKTAAKQAATKRKPAARKGSPLLAAAEALISGDASKLPLLLDAWRACPSAPLGELIVRFAPDEHELGGLAKLSTVDLTRAVVKLGRREPDPRIASALAAMVVAPPYTSRSMQGMWTSLFEQLTEVHVDPRALARLREADVAAQFGGTNMGQWVGKALAGAIEALAARLDDEPPQLDEDDGLEKLLERETSTTAKPSASKEVSADSEQAFVARCLAAPDDDGPRLVYADWLELHGEAAHAELIRLQLERARSGEAPGERERQLLDKHAHKWLAEIVPVLKKGAWTFERGLLDSCTIYPRKGKAAELAGHWLWASVRAATLSETGDPAPIITHPIMARLRTVELWTYPRGLAGMLDSDAPIEEIHHVYVPNVARDRGLWDAFVGCSRLPKLRLVQLGGASLEQVQAIASGGLARPGMRLIYAVQGYQARAWLPLLATLAPEPAHTLITRHTEFELDHASKTLRATLAGEATEALWDVGLAFAVIGRDDALTLERGQIATLELRVPSGGVSGPMRYSEEHTAEGLLEGIAARCGELGCALKVIEGDWPTRWVGQHHVRL